MSEKMLITQALDERDLLMKKISDKISRATFVDTIKHNEENVFKKRIMKDEFAKEAEAAYQQIKDLIARYQKIDAAVIASNAKTEIQTSYGTYTIAAAISLRYRLRDSLNYDEDLNFEALLIEKMKREYDTQIQQVETKNKQLQLTAENMRLSILGKDVKVKDDKPLEVVDVYVKENSTELVDPLHIEDKIAALTEKQQTLLTELDTQIKVSNATTFIEI